MRTYPRYVKHPGEGRQADGITAERLVQVKYAKEEWYFQDIFKPPPLAWYLNLRLIT